MSEPIPDDVVLPCGCVMRHAIVEGTKTITFVPCRMTCVNYLNAVGLATEQGKPVTYREGR